MVVVVGAGGVGTFAAQSAKAFGAHVAAIDVDARRLEALAPYVDLPLDASRMDAKAIRGAVAAFEKERGLPAHGRKLIECSGVAAGQETAYALLNHDAVLAVVGFTMDKVSLRLSNLMAFDATAFGNWGCLPRHFPAILSLVREGKIAVAPFVERFPMSRLNELLKEGHHARRPVLIPDFEE
jgi:6-hydroxycyclohex-1-ene-1-carbonyl-CoA dehydrogenase